MLALAITLPVVLLVFIPGWLFIFALCRTQPRRHQYREVLRQFVDSRMTARSSAEHKTLAVAILRGDGLRRRTTTKVVLPDTRPRLP